MKSKSEKSRLQLIKLLDDKKAVKTTEGGRCLRDDVQKKPGKISDIEQKGGRGVESISLFLIY